MEFDIDNQFLDYFSNLKQVFLYIINECNLNCPQCIYKPNNYFNIGDKEIPLDIATRLLKDFYTLGAKKLSLLGGEPTLYGKATNYEYGLPELIAIAKEIGYSYVRIDTNGTFDSKLLYNSKFGMLDEISFSLDGYDSDSNDLIRGKGNFKKTTDNILCAVKLGYNVDITCCVYQEMLLKDENGEFIIEKVIHLAEELGINRLNFHALIKDGTPIDLWSSDLHVNPKDWLDVFNVIGEKIKNGKYKLPVRIPQCFIKKDDFDNNPKYYGFCPAKLGERVLVHPDGIIRICSGLLGTPYSVADYYDNKIRWNKRKTNELIEHKKGEYTPCTNRSKKDFGQYLPLCFSFKPNQKEFVYSELLNWEDRKN